MVRPLVFIMRLNIYEAKSQLSKLTELALAGEDVIIAKADKPLLKLVPYNPKSSAREPDLLAGQIKVADDAFSAETDTEIAASLESSSLFPGETGDEGSSK